MHTCTHIILSHIYISTLDLPIYLEIDLAFMYISREEQVLGCGGRHCPGRGEMKLGRQVETKPFCEPQQALALALTISS